MISQLNCVSKTLRFLILACSALATAGQSQAGVITPLNFSAGLNTGYSVSDVLDVDGNVDWFVFDANGSDVISFFFDRTIAAPDLVAGLYLGDTTGFDYVAAGATSYYSFFDAASFNPALTFVTVFDDSHPNALGGPFGDPDFSLVLAAGRYSLALSSLDQAGTYEFTSSVSSANATVPEPASFAIFGLGALGCCMLAGRKTKRTT